MRPPRVERSSERVLTVEEIRAICHEAYGSPWYAAFCVLALMGMRISELLGLEWKNYNPESGTLRIERQTGRVYREPGVRLLPLKTKESERTVHIPPFARQILQWHADAQKMGRRRSEGLATWEDHGTIFCGPTGALYFRSQAADEFRRITLRLGIEGATLHTFCHSVTTLVQESGLPLRVAQSLMGHATDRTTHRIYSHLSTNGLERVAQVMEQLFGDLPTMPTIARLTAQKFH
jgi:integrase